MSLISVTNYQFLKGYAGSPASLNRLPTCQLVKQYLTRNRFGNIGAVDRNLVRFRTCFSERAVELPVFPGYLDVRDIVVFA